MLHYVVLLVSLLLLSCGSNVEQKTKVASIADSKPSPLNLTPIVVKGDAFHQITLFCPNGYKESTTDVADSLVIVDPEVGNYIINVEASTDLINLPVTGIGIRIDGTDEQLVYLDGNNKTQEYVYYPYQFTINLKAKGTAVEAK